MSAWGGPLLADYQPFTEQFNPSLGAFPADLMQPITDRFVGPDMPADLMEKWNREFVAPDVATIHENPIVQARVKLGMDAIQRGAAARGTLLTPGVQMGIAEYAGDVAVDEYQNIWDRARAEFNDAYGMFTGDKERRRGVWNDQFAQGLGTFQANTGLKLNDRAQRAGFYGDQFGRDMSTFNTRFDVHRDNQLTPFGMGVQREQLGQSGRALDENLRMGEFNRNRASYLDDFNIWHTLDSDYYDRLFRQAELGRP